MREKGKERQDENEASRRAVLCDSIGDDDLRRVEKKNCRLQVQYLPYLRDGCPDPTTVSFRDPVMELGGVPLFSSLTFRSICASSVSGTYLPDLTRLN